MIFYPLIFILDQLISCKKKEKIDKILCLFVFLFVRIILVFDFKFVGYCLKLVLEFIFVVDDFLKILNCFGFKVYYWNLTYFIESNLFFL